ncbi:MAG: type II toxin-antitoxin system VapC family toxin [Salinibacter sp.]
MTLARQELTREWWNTRRHRHELYTSEVVIGEAGEGDEEAAQQRLDALRGLKELETSAQAEDLATALLEEGPLPEKAAVDALHIAISATEEIEYLLTWNCTHIANAAMRKPIEEVCRTRGVDAPIMCTPEELMEE